MGLSARLAGIAPWAGVIGAGTGWALHQQVVANALHFGCDRTAGGAGVAWGVLALAIVLGGALVSWRALPGKDDPSPVAAVRRFAVHLGVMATGLAVLGIAFMMVATALLPGCRP